MGIGPQILKTAESLFLKYGLKSVSMDDISKENGISKKTLYQYFDTKESLIDAVLNSMLQDDMELTTSLHHEAKNAIDEMVIISQHVNQIISSISPSTHYDLNKYYKEQYQQFRINHSKIILDFIQHNLTRGIEEGVYRQNLDIQGVSQLYLLLTYAMFENYNELQISNEPIKMFNVFMSYHMHSICTPLGIEQLNHIQNRTS